LNTFESPLFQYLGQDYKTLAIYKTIFKNQKPEKMGESYYLNSRENGISLGLDKSLAVRSIFLYSDGVEKFKQYQGKLPANLSFTSNQKVVRKQLGEPAMSAEAGGVGIMAIEFAFDRYESKDFYIRFEYHKSSEAIRLITIGEIE
jgi:hypothetical protein